MSAAEIMEWLAWYQVESELAETRRLQHLAQAQAERGLEELKREPPTKNPRRR